MVELQSRITALVHFVVSTSAHSTVICTPGL